MKKPQPIGGQVSLFDEAPDLQCDKRCVCPSCLMWWSGRCPYGGCYDHHRAEVNPYDKAHPNEPPRTAWSNWKTEQAYWCRGGVFYPTIYCEHYIEYRGSNVQDCLYANVEIFQDGYKRCSLVESVGCEACYKRFLEKLNEEEEP